MKLILIYTTHKNTKEAEKIINHLLDKKMIACTNIFPIKSMYLWKGKINSGKEVIAILKTKKENWTKVQKEIKNIHPYEIPCILKIETEVNKEYGSWLQSELL